MEFRVLGSLDVVGAAAGRVPSGAKERAVLARLLMDPTQVVSREQLVEAGWADGAARAGAVRSLHVRISGLRRFLEPGRGPGAPSQLLVGEPAGYRLAVDPGQVDAWRFERSVQEAEELDAVPALERCDRALAMWRGPPYTEWAGADFAQAEIRRLEEVRHRAWQRRAAALLELGRHVEAVAQLEQLVAEDPLREELVCDLMLALYRSGRQVDALAAYRRLAARLDELGLRPGPAARELEHLVLRHAPQLAPPAAPPEERPPSNLAGPLSSFVGRAEELAAVAGRLAGHRLVTVCGPGGVGKTRLAEEAGRTLLADFPGGVWLVELAAVREAARAAGAIATALGLRRVGLEADGGDRDALGLLVEYVRDRRVLVILDNAEHLLPALAPTVAGLAAAAPALRVLVTSRRPLGLPGEAVLDLAPLGLPPAGAGADALAESDAGRLFTDRVRAVRRGWAPEGGQAVAAARICRRLDGLPLALELAAARLRALDATDVADRLDASTAALGGSLAALPERQRTLEGVAEWSHRLLTDAQRAVFRRLAVFEDAFGLEDAERVAAGDGIDEVDVVDHLVSLVEQSMLQVDGESPRRYRLLQPLRDFARRRWKEPEERQVLADRHAQRFADLAGERVAHTFARGPEATVEPLIPCRHDLAAALEHALARGSADVALPLAMAVGVLHHRFAQPSLGHERLAAALALAGGEPSLRLGAMIVRAGLLLNDVRATEALAVLEDCHAPAAALGDPAMHERVALAEGQARLFALDLAGAEALLRDLPAALARRGEPWAEGVALNGLGFAVLLQGRPAEAEELLAAACRAFEASGDICSLDSAAADLARAELVAGRYAAAAVTCGRYLALTSRPDHERATALLYADAMAAAWEDRPQDAVRRLSACPTAARHDPLRTAEWFALVGRGDLQRMDGDVAAAGRSYDQALALLERIGREAGPSMPVALALADTFYRLGRVAEEQDLPGEALRLQRAGLAAAADVGCPAVVAASLEGIAGALALAECEPDAAALLRAAAELRAAAGVVAFPDERADAGRTRERLGPRADTAPAGEPIEVLVRRWRPAVTAP